MSIENDMTARVLGKILAEGMSLSDCELENEIDSEALDKLKEIREIVFSDVSDKQKVSQVKNILTE